MHPMNPQSTRQVFACSLNQVINVIPMCVIFEPIMSATAIVLPLRVCYAPPLSAVTFRVPCLIGSDGSGGGEGDRRTVYTRIRIYAERADTVDNQTACVRILAEHKHTAHTHTRTHSL